MPQRRSPNFRVVAAVESKAAGEVVGVAVVVREAVVAAEADPAAGKVVSAAAECKLAGGRHPIQK